MKRKCDEDASVEDQCAVNASAEDQRVEDDTSEPIALKRLRRYNYTIHELQQKLKLAQHASEGKLHISTNTHPFPMVTVDRLLHDLCDVDHPPEPSEVDPQRVQLIVDILWQLARCQNRPHLAPITKPHEDDAKFPAIAMMFRRNRFFQRLVYVAEMPRVGVQTQASIVNIFAVCAVSAPARQRLFRNQDVAHLLASFLSSRVDETTMTAEENKALMLRDEAALRCLLACRDVLNQIQSKTVDHILAAICRRIEHWKEIPINFQLACAFLVCSVDRRFDSLLTMSLLLHRVVEAVVTGPRAHDIESVRPVLGFVRVLVVQPNTTKATLALLMHTPVLQLLANVITMESVDELSLLSALASVSNICYDLTVVNSTSQIKEKFVPLGSPLLTLAHSSPSELVRFESFAALFMLIQMLNVYVSDQGFYSKPWNSLLDWETFAQCVFAQLEANARSQPPDLNACLAAVSAAWIAVVRLGSCDWLKPSVRDWDRILTRLSTTPSRHDSDNAEEATGQETVAYQVRHAASTLSNLLFSHQSFVDPADTEPSLLV